MSCPHRELFSCEECIRESIRRNYDPNRPDVFARLRAANSELSRLRAALEGARETLADAHADLIPVQRDMRIGTTIWVGLANTSTRILKGLTAIDTALAEPKGDGGTT